MPKFNLISDVHLNWDDLTLPGGDLLIASGDIVESGHLKAFDQGKNVFLAERIKRFFSEELIKYEKVIYVFGNHEYYHDRFESAKDRIQNYLPSNTTILENQSLQIEDVWVYGATFWTNLNNENPLTKILVKNEMSDYKLIKHKQSIKLKNPFGQEYYTSKFTPEFTTELFKDTLSKFQLFLADHPSDKILVASHHAPSPISLVDQNDFHINGAYHTNLTTLMIENPNIKAWVHGHIHKRNDYMIGNCRVLSNPRGYSRFEELPETFNPAFSFEI